MATNEIGEKVYYSDVATRVTNVRITCEHITVPVGKVGSVELNFRTEGFVFGILVFFLSFTPFVFFGFLPEDLKAVFAVASLILMAASAAWTFIVYRNYVELRIAVNERKFVLLSVNMGRQEYLSRIASAIGDAITDEDRYRKMKASGDSDAGLPGLNLSETMRLKMILEDYENIKGLKNIIFKPEAATGA